MTLSAAETEYKARPQDKQPLRSEIQDEIAQFEANGGRIQ